MKNNELIFFNFGELKTSNNSGKEIDVNVYKNGVLKIKVGTIDAYEQNIRPNLVNGIYREYQLDFISIVQLDHKDAILSALVTAEPNRSLIAKGLIGLLKKDIKLYYNLGMISAEEGFDDFNKYFNKYYWSNDILDKTNIYDWQGGKPRLLPVIK